MPAAVGVAVAGWITGGVAASSAIATTAAIAGAAASAAVTGAIVGAATAIVTGGDILKGALTGAALGAVTGGIAGYMGSTAPIAEGAAGKGITTGSGVKTIGENAFGNPVASGSTGVNTAGVVPNSTVGTSGIGTSVTKAAAPPKGLLQKIIGDVSPDEKAKIIGSTVSGVGKAGSEYLAAREASDSQMDLAEWREKQADINRSEAAPVLFQQQTSNINPPDWWTTQLEKRGLLA